MQDLLKNTWAFGSRIVSCSIQILTSVLIYLSLLGGSTWKAGTLAFSSCLPALIIQ